MIARHARDFTWNRGGYSSNSPPLTHGNQIPHLLEDADNQIPSSSGRQKCQIPMVCPGRDVEASIWPIHYLCIMSFFVHWKSIFFLSTVKEFEVTSIYKYVSTTRLKSKTFALQYLGPKSSKLSPKPLVRKLTSLSFRCHFWLSQIFDQRLLFGYKQLCIWPLELSEHYEPRHHSQNQRLKPLRKGEYNLIISVSFTLVISVIHLFLVDH